MLFQQFLVSAFAWQHLPEAEALSASSASSLPPADEAVACILHPCGESLQPTPVESQGTGLKEEDATIVCLQEVVKPVRLHGQSFLASSLPLAP